MLLSVAVVGVRFSKLVLRLQVPCAIGCSDNAEEVEKGLEATGLASFFEAVRTPKLEAES